MDKVVLNEEAQRTGRLPIEDACRLTIERVKLYRKLLNNEENGKNCQRNK